MGGRTSFLKALKPNLTHTLSSCSTLLCESRESEQSIHHLLSPITQITLHYMHQYQPGWFTELPLRDNHSTVYTQEPKNVPFSLFFSPSNCLCLSYISDHRTICSHSTWGNSLRSTKPNNNGVPKGTKRSPSTTPTSPPPGTPLPGGKPKPDGP